MTDAATEKTLDRPLLFAHAFPVGTRYVCTLSINRPALGELAAVTPRWSPRRPKHLRDFELVDYRAGRAKAMAAFAEFLAASTTRTLGAGQSEPT